MVFCNTTLVEIRIENEQPLFSKVTFHHVGLIVCAVFGSIAMAIAFFLMHRHATHYSQPSTQKPIIRILFMIPIYATVSFLSYMFYWHAIYFEVMRDCYEAFAIASFFSLLCNYIATDLHAQKEYFRSIKPKNWLWPMNWCQKCAGGKQRGCLRVPYSGLTWFNIIWVGVFQYCLIRVMFTIVSVISQVTRRYCESSLNPAFAHIWVMVFEGVSVTIAMYCLIQFYYQTKSDIETHRPFLKILCIKLVIFFSFWQTLVISFLSSGDKPVLVPSQKIQYPDIKVGIPNMLLCIEMAIFSIMHIFAFPWKGYVLQPHDPATYKGGPLGLKAYMDAFNPWDIMKAAARGLRWLFIGVRHRQNDVSYQNPNATKLTAAEGSDYNDTSYKPHQKHSKNNGPYSSLTEDETEDNSGLLSHSQVQPYGRPNPYAKTNNPDSLPYNPTPESATESVPPQYGGFAPANPYSQPYQGGEPDSLPYNPTPQSATTTRPPGKPAGGWHTTVRDV